MFLLRTRTQEGISAMLAIAPARRPLEGGLILLAAALLPSRDRCFRMIRCARASEHTPRAVVGGRTLCAPTSGAPGRRALRPLVGAAQEIIRRHVKIIRQGNQALKIRTAPPTLIILIGTYLNPQIFRYLPLGGTFSLPFQGHALCKLYQLTTSLLTCTICAVTICTDSASSDVTSFFKG